MEEKRKDATTPPLENIPASASEPPVSEPPPPRRGRGPGQKRKASAIGGGNTSASPTTSSKRQAREKSPSNPFLPIHNGPLTRARQQPSIAAAATTSPPSVSAVKDTAVAPQPDAAAVKAKEAKEAWEALEAKIEAAYEVIKSRDANSHVVPTHAGWFSWTKLHQLEERMLPSFFNGKSENRTREIYKEIRDWIMKKYHSNPTTQIELKDLSELSVGDEEAKQEVMEFLDYWGLINFHPFPQTNSTPMSIETDADADADNNDNDIDKDSKEKSLIESLFRFEKEEFFVPIVPSSNLATPSLPSGLFPESAINEELVKSEGQGVEYHCNSCSGDCSRKRYHCQKQADFDLCSECFNNGKFGSDMSPSDFILMEPGESGGASGGKWTDQETLLLLEALELYKENWTEIAEHVATKTKSQCILHFIEMPIEDTFLDSDDVTEAPPPSNNNETSASKDGPSKITEVKEGTNENQPLSSPIETSKPENGNKSKDMVEESESFAVKALKEAFEGVGYLPSPKEKLSFADASNPVMTLASFLVRLVEPNTTTASVHGSLKSISEHSAGEHLAARHCFFLEDPPDENESVTIEMAEQGDQKDEEDQNKDTQIEEVEEKSESVTDDKQNEEKLTPVTDESNEKDKEKDPVSEKDGVVLLPTDKSDPIKDSNGAEPSNVSESENHELASEQISDTTAIGETTQPAEASKDEDMISETETGQLNTSNPIVGEEAKAGIEEAKDEKKDEKKKETSLDKLKHAAVTALSAAAVKAKILAKEEEDQIRKLSALLIEKQLNKLETKLAFFNEMDSVVMKVREQFERSKQKLYHERAQIIATRLGMGGGPQLRPQSVAVANRVGGNSAPRPPLSSGSALKPPGSGSGSRTMMGSPPVAGTSVQTGDQEKLSSVTTTK